MVFAHLRVGPNKISKLWIPVVPDKYLSTDLLLGCNVLGQSTLTWDHSKGILIWGDEVFPIRYIPHRHKQVF